MIAARRTHVTLMLPGAPARRRYLDRRCRPDDSASACPAQSLEVVREDIAAVSSRSVSISRPNDEPMTIPSNGFSLAGTLSKPAQASAAQLPAVVLVGGSGPTDRDGLAFGIPILGQLAGALADAGFIVVRYDKRGIGQSGGRAESASLADYAEDVRAAVKLLADRKDVDPKRIAVVGHSEGGLVALMAAAKEKTHRRRRPDRDARASPARTSCSRSSSACSNRMTLTAEEKQAKVDARSRSTRR